MSNTRELSQLASVISVADETINIGIGTTNPTSKLHIVGDIRVSGVVTASSFSGNGSGLTGVAATTLTIGAGTTALPSISPTGDSNTGIFFPSADTVAISEGGAEALRVDSSGRLLIGTTTAPTTVNGIKQFCVETSGSYTTALLVTNQNNVNSAYLALQKSRGSTAGSMTAVQNNDELGSIMFIGTDGTTPQRGAEITAFVDGTPGANDMPGRLVFYTTADGSASLTEAMRINSQQELLVGTATRTANGGKLQISNGITFPATAVACTDANTLDDYEEGTWTPQLTGFTMSGSNGGKYIKVGRIVTVEAVLQWSSGTSPGTALVTGLPFANSGGVRSTGAFGLSNGASIIPTAGYTWLTTHIDVGASTVQIIQNGTTGNSGAVTIASSGVVFAFGLTYLSA